MGYPRFPLLLLCRRYCLLPLLRERNTCPLLLASSGEGRNRAPRTKIKTRATVHIDDRQLGRNQERLNQVDRTTSRRLCDVKSGVGLVYSPTAEGPRGKPWPGAVFFFFFLACSRVTPVQTGRLLVFVFLLASFFSLVANFLPFLSARLPHPHCVALLASLQVREAC